MKGNLFRIANQLVRSNNDVVVSGSVKDREGDIAIYNSRIGQVWKDYFEKLLNEEFEWNKDILEDASQSSGPGERITDEEVRAAIAKAKVGKAAGPTGLVSEMSSASGEIGASLLTDLFNAIVKEGRIPADWKKSWIISMYKGKGDALECDLSRGIKLFDQVIKVFQRVLERKMRNYISLVDVQIGLRPGRGTTDAIFIARQIQEKLLAQKRPMYSICGHEEGVLQSSSRRGVVGLKTDRS